MIRPSSIVNFERLYLGSIAVWLLGVALNWNNAMAMAGMQLADNPAFASQPPERLGQTVALITIGTIVVSLLVALLLWYFTARKASTVTKWIVTLFTALSVLSAISGLAMRGVAGGQLVGVLATVLAVAAVVFLFRPDANAWFASKGRVA